MKRQSKPPPKPKGQKDQGNRSTSTKPQKEGSSKRENGKPNIASQDDFPKLMLPLPPPVKKAEDAAEGNKEPASSVAVTPHLPLPPPPGNLGTPMHVQMGNATPGAPTPKSLKAVEQVLPTPKETQKDSKDTECTDIGQLANHLQQMLIAGDLKLPDSLQQTVLSLQDQEPPKSTNMFALENQRRKWQKKLQQNQEKLETSNKAWNSFLSDVARHLAMKEEQYRSIKTNAEQAIQEAQMKLQEITAAMQEQIPKESKNQGIPTVDEAATAMKAHQLRQQLENLQSTAESPSPEKLPAVVDHAPSSQVPQTVEEVEDVEILSEETGPVHVQSDGEDDGNGFQPVRHNRSRSRQDGNSTTKAKRRSRKATSNTQPQNVTLKK